jgi:hypothetical protein
MRDRFSRVLPVGGLGEEFPDVDIGLFSFCKIGSLVFVRCSSFGARIIARPRPRLL